MTQRPLPKTVTPLADELLSGWLTRLAVTNHCEVDELLAHIGVDTRQVAMLDFDVEVDATSNKGNLPDDRRSGAQSHPIHADRIALRTGRAVATMVPSASSFSRIPMLIRPCRAAWA